MEMTQTQQIAMQMAQDAPLTMAEIISREVATFLASEGYREAKEAGRYYQNRTAIQRKNTDLQGRSNTRIEHPIYKRLVDQKLRYLLGKPFFVSAQQGRYYKALEALFDDGFRRRIRLLAKCAMRDGIGYLQPYIDETGCLKFANLPATNVIPLWSDSQEMVLSGYIQLEEQMVYHGKKPKLIRLAALWDTTGVQLYQDDGDGKFYAVGDLQPHFYYGDLPMNWEAVPLVYVRYHDDGLPLLRYVKELIDDYNFQTSITADALRDVAKFVYILKNYGGEDLNQFVGELRRSLAIQVDEGGGVDKLQPEVDVTGVLSFLDKQRQDLYEFSAAVDTRDLGGTSESAKAIAFRYMDLDGDCRDLAGALDAMFVHLKPFIDTWLTAQMEGNFQEEPFRILFDMHLPVDESDRIANLVSSADFLSTRTLLEQHPWVSNVDAELSRLEATI
ncbi:phage portal protein [Bengtsoniella intestinalis]|uniref:phage portal protein n=1 Tax=Bengtsoniella intestinalis TaxID=3073143 RepID=UPI00391FB62D